jgi:hypothetical protein
LLSSLGNKFLLFVGGIIFFKVVTLPAPFCIVFDKNGQVLVDDVMDDLKEKVDLII